MKAEQLYPILAGVGALAFIVDGLFISKNTAHAMTGLALLAPGVIPAKKK